MCRSNSKADFKKEETGRRHIKCLVMITQLGSESGSIPLRNWIFLLIPSPIPELELELALPSPGGIVIELKLPSFEFELESELPSWN